MKRAKPGSVQGNSGVQARNVSAEVMAVGSRARASKVSRDLGPERTGDHLRILFLASNPQAMSPLNLAEELRMLENELRGARFRRRIVLTMGHAVQPDDLVRLLRSDRPMVVHFSGHGSREGIVLLTDRGYITVPAEILVRLFHGRGIRLVVLNSCFSDAQALVLKDVVTAVVGTTADVEDEAARRFTAAFYRTIGNGHRIEDAFRDGGDAVTVHKFVDVFHAHGDLKQTLFDHLPSGLESDHRSPHDRGTP